MITNKDIEELYEAGEVKKATLKNKFGNEFDIYFYELDHSPQIEEIYKKHKVDFGFSEWRSFIWHRQMALKEQHGIQHSIPLTSKETCVSCGL